MRFDLLPLLLSFLCACAIARYVANDEHFCRAEFFLLFIFSLRFLIPVSAFLFLNVSSQSLYFVFHFNINFSFLLPAFVPFLSSCSNLFL